MSERRISYRPEFFLDAADVTHWYDERQPGLGQRFLDALDHARNSVRDSPESFPMVEGSVRVCMLRRLPYGVYFRATTDDLLILGVFHLHRDVDSWRSRMAD